MAYCTTCGSKLSDDARFCSACGHKVTQADDDERAQKYAGALVKCPSCGEALPSFATHCPACGHEMRDVAIDSSIQELSRKLEEIQEMENSEGMTSKLMRRVGLINAESYTQQMVDVIYTFPIPNTREDILEFMILATSNLQPDALAVYLANKMGSEKRLAERRKALAEAWLSKMEQAFQKAQVALGTSDEFEQIRTMYETKRDEAERAKRKGALLRLAPFIALLILLLAYFFVMFLLLNH